MQSTLKYSLGFFLCVAIVFAFVFTAMRAYEYAHVNRWDFALQYEAMGYGYDWAVAFRLIAICFVPHLLISLLSPKGAQIFSVALFLLVLVSAFCLTQYFVVTGVPLSTDLFGYSMTDIRITVRSSSGFDWITLLAFVLYILFFVAGCLIVVRKTLAVRLPWRFVWPALTVILVVGILPLRPGHARFERETHYNLAVNKYEYFLKKTVAYVNDRTFRSSLKLSAGSYPFLKPVEYKDVLGEFFAESQELPNFVFILVEGLGRDFTGQGARYSGFTPFLDSLAASSLYFSNGISNAGRTFGALPSILGSLPYGTNGFMNYGVDMPRHQTLISLLKKNGYTANFFYGGNPNFDNQDLFLQYQGIDFMLNESNFPPSYEKPGAADGAFSWGYSDRQVLRRSLEYLSEKNSSPRIDIYLTLTTHEPFDVPEKNFELAADKSVQRLDANSSRQYADHKKIFSCLLYTDDALREFIHSYKKRPEYTKSIFIITGDHRLVPVPQDTKLSRFHVPIMVFSPMLKTSKNFESLALHSDIAPTILGFLANRHQLEFPVEMPFISGGLDTLTTFSSDLDVALIRNKGDIDDYIFRDYYFSDGQLFRIRRGLVLEPASQDSVYEAVEEKLATFRDASRFACENDRLDTKSGGGLQLFSFSVDEQDFLDTHEVEEQQPDDLFRKAFAVAQRGDYAECRIWLRYLLNRSPNYHDARILLARTFAWNKQFDTAQYFVDQVFKRSPYYDGAFNAASDIAFWRDDFSGSLAFAEKGLASHPANLELLARKSRGLWLAGRKDEARLIAESVLDKFPDHEIALDVIQKIQHP